MKNKKLKWAIPATVLALTGGSMVALTGCDNGGKPEVPPEPTHTHQYTEWDFTQSEHWKFCPDDGTVNEASREAHDSADETGKCPECGYQLFEYIDQAAKLVLRKEGANTAIPLLDNVTIVIKQGGKTLVDGADYTIEKGEGNALKIKKIVLGDYRVEIATTDGQYSYSGVIGFDGTAEKEIVLQYKYAVATEKPDVIDLTGMNDEMPTLKIKSSGAAAFEYWNAPVPEIALTLTDQEKSSLDVTLEFNLKGENSNNQPCNSFGIVMTEDYAAGVGLGFWNIEDESGNFVFEMIGQKLGCDNFQNNGYKSGDENAREKTIEWLTKLIYGEKGADFQVTRKGGTISVKAKLDGNWTEIATADCGAVVTNDIKFLGVGSDYTITVKSLTAVEFVEETVTATFASIGDDTFNVDGVELTFTGRHTYKGTPSRHTLTIADMAVGDYNVSATVNGLTVGLGRATVTKNDEDIGVGTLTLDGNIGENAEAAYAGYNLKDLAITLDLKNGGNMYHNKFVTSVPESSTNYILYHISLPANMKTKLADANKKINFSMPIVINNDEQTVRFIIQNGDVKYQLYGGGVKEAMGDFWGKAKEISLGSDFWTALTDASGEGIYLAAYIDKTEKTLHTYLGTSIAEMKVAADYALFTSPINTIGISMGNAVDMNIDDGSQVTVAIKYGTTMAEVGMTEAVKVTLTGKLSDESPAKGTVEIASGIHYVGDKCTVTVTTESGYSLKELKVGNGAPITTWTQKGNVYTVEITVPEADAEVVATLEESPTVATAEITVSTVNGFTADGAVLTFTTPGYEWKGTVTGAKVTIGEANNPVVLGTLSVSATVNGFTLNLGNVTVAKTVADENKGEGTLTLDSGTVLVKAESALPAFDLKDLAITLDLKNGGNVYHNKFVTGITAAETNYILYKISLPQDMKVALTGNTSKKLNISMPIIINGSEPSTAKFVFENGKVLSSFWGGGVNDAGYDFYGHEVDLGSDFWTALTTGDGFYMVAYINKTDKNLRVYVGTALNEMRLTEDVTAIYNDGVNTIGIAMGNAVDVASMSDGDQVTVAIKYGTTMAEVGTQEAAKHSVTTSVAEGSEDMGSISASGECYVNTNYTVTVTANAGYELESLTVGGTAVDMKDVTKTGLTYTYTFRVTADTAVVAEFRQAATVNATFTASGEDAPASGTAIKLTNTSTNVVKDAVIGTAIALEPGTYKLLVYGYAEQEVEVTTDGTIALMLAKTIAYASANDTKGEITINDTDKTISFNGNGAADRNGDRKISADLVLTEEQKNAKELTLTFTIKRGEFTRNGDDWAASRFGVQLGTGEVGFYVFMRSAQNNAADVAKLINNSLSLNPSGSEQKWHGNDPDISWVSDAAYGGGLQMKVVRSGGVIHIYALNGTTWVQLDVAAGVSTDGEGNTAGGYLAIDDSVENEIKLLAGGDDWTYSGITVETTAWTPTTEVGEEA